MVALKSRRGLSQGATVGMFVVLVVLVISGAYLISTRSSSTPVPTSTSSSYSSASQSTSSTLPTSTQAASGLSGLGPHSIGYVGCSNSADAVTGYYLVQNRGLLWQAYSTGGGSLDLWADASSQYWTLFDQQVQHYGQPRVVWINICERAVAPISYKMVQQVFAMLKTHAPAATYYISPLNSYSPSGICALTGPNGVADSAALADQAVASGLALTGPVLGPLTAQTTQSDMCHPNTSGKVLVGGQLEAFFDK